MRPVRILVRNFARSPAASYVMQRIYAQSFL